MSPPARWGPIWRCLSYALGEIMDAFMNVELHANYGYQVQQTQDISMTPAHNGRLTKGKQVYKRMSPPSIDIETPF